MPAIRTQERFDDRSKLTSHCSVVGMRRLLRACIDVDMLGLIGFLLVLWLVFVVVGFVAKGLLWLAIVGIVLFVATAVWGWIKRNAST